MALNIIQAFREEPQCISQIRHLRLRAVEHYSGSIITQSYDSMAIYASLFVHIYICELNKGSLFTEECKRHRATKGLGESAFTPTKLEVCYLALRSGCAPPEV